MGQFVLSRAMRVMGWLGTLVMAAASVAFLVL